MIFRKTYNYITKKIDMTQEDIKQNSADIKRAADLGDLKENAEYHAAKERQILLHHNLQRLANQLSNEVVEPEDIDTSIVSFGTRVTYTDGTTNITVSIAGSAEYDLDLFKNIVTATSPFAKKILGKKVGDSITMDLPAGEKTFTILEIALLD
jgi:transcription elongation factor GreA